MFSWNYIFIGLDRDLIKQKYGQTNNFGLNVLSIDFPRFDCTSHNSFPSLVPFFFPLSFISWVQTQILPENYLHTKIHNLEITDKQDESHTIMPKHFCQKITKINWYCQQGCPVALFWKQIRVHVLPHCHIFSPTTLILPFIFLHRSLKSRKIFSLMWKTHRSEKALSPTHQTLSLPPTSGQLRPLLCPQKLGNIWNRTSCTYSAITPGETCQECPAQSQNEH